MDVRGVLAQAAELGPFFTVGTDPITDPHGRPAAELYADPRPLRDRIAHVRRALDTDDRVAASITFQGLAAQLVSAPFAAVVQSGVLPGLTADALYWCPTASGPWSLRCPAPTAVEVPGIEDGAAALAALLLEEHLIPLVTAVRAQVPVARRVLWGNAASGVAGAKRLLVAAHPALSGRAAVVAEWLLASGPLAGTGRFLPPSDPDREWTFRRRSCCLYYRVPGGGLCEDCVLQDRSPGVVGAPAPPAR